MEQASLTKGKQRFLFRWERGDEKPVLDEVSRMVHDTTVDFDWFDAAVISCQVGWKLAEELRQYLPKKVCGGERG